jgi:hypothetical protein
MLTHIIFVIAISIALQGCGGSTKTSSSKTSTSVSSSVQTASSVPASAVTSSAPIASAPTSTAASSIEFSSVSSPFSSTSNISNSSSSYSPALPGDATAPALDAITTIAPVPSADADIDNGVIMTKFDVRLTQDATIGQVNTALAGIGAQIASMDAGSAMLTVAFPRATDINALEQKQKKLQTYPGIFFVGTAVAPTLDSLPPEPANAEANLGYLFASKFPAAWNLSQLIISNGECKVPKVDVVVVDHFAQTPPSTFSAEVPGFSVINPIFLKSDIHGNLVAAAIAAQFDSGTSTGANPFSACLNIKGIELESGTERELNKLVAMNLPATPVIVNMSFGTSYPHCRPNCTPANFQDFSPDHNAQLAAVVSAIDWRERLFSLDRTAFFITTAGNERNREYSNAYPLFGIADAHGAAALSAIDLPSFLVQKNLVEPAAEYSAYPSIALAKDILEELNQSFLRTKVDLRSFNVMTVGSAKNSTTDIIESAFSNSGPAVHAIGEGGINLLGENSLRGTSFSAAQASGLASYLWLLSPALRGLQPSVTLNAIEDNAFMNGDVRLIDAYASVLSLDDVGPVTPASRPIRLALLDVDANGVFNAADVEQISVALLDTTGEPSDAQQHWDRYDLNGDGYTGGTRTSWFDLDRTTSTRFGAAVYNANTSQTIGEKNIVFDEIAVTDLDVLCYYAYSPLYTGDTTLRDARLLAPCANKYGTATSAPSVVSSVVSGDTVFAYSPLPTPTSAQGVWMVPYDLTLNQWGTAQLMAPIGPSYATQASIATSKKSLNDVLFVWQANATANILSVAHFDKARAKWLDTVTIPLSASAILDSISVAVSDNGDACVAWIQLANGNFNVFASVARHTTGVWTDPQQIGTVGPAGGSTLSAVAARNGVFHVAWSQVKLNPDIGGYDSFIAATHYDGTWHQAEPLLPFVSPSSGNHPQLGIHEESGDVYALWQSAGSTVIAAVRDATTGLWTGPGLQAFDCPPPTPAPGARPGCYPHLIVNDQGDAIATWVNQLITTTYASYYSRSTHSWSAPVVMATPNTSGETFPVMDDAGNGRVIWRGLKTPYVYVPGGPPPPPTFILSRRIVAGGGWGPIETIVEGNNPGFYAPPIMTPNGTTFITGYEGGGKYFSKRFK